jgi:hypothetical protein
MEQNDSDLLVGDRQLGFSYVRLLPKEAGVRPIVNLRRRAVKTSVSLSLKSSKSGSLVCFCLEHREWSLTEKMTSPRSVLRPHYYCRLLITRFVGFSRWPQSPLNWNVVQRSLGLQSTTCCRIPSLFSHSKRSGLRRPPSYLHASYLCIRRTGLLPSWVPPCLDQTRFMPS